MITKELAATLRVGQVLWHVHEKGSDGKPVRARVNGKLVTGRRPAADRSGLDFGKEWHLPMKFGIRMTFYIMVPSDYTNSQPEVWCLPENWEREHARWLVEHGK